MMSRKHHPVLSILMLLALLVGLLSTPMPAQAGTAIVVNTFVDEWGTTSNCSLREAIYAANHDQSISGCSAGSGADTILLDSGTYRLTLAQNAGESDGDRYPNPKMGDPGDVKEQLGDLDILSAVTIVGKGSGLTNITGILVVDPETRINTRIMEVNAPNLTVQLRDLSIEGGNAIVTTNGGRYMGVGGGIYNRQGLLNLFRVSINNNKAEVAGGGVYNDYFIGTSLSISSSFIQNNQVEEEDGGGILNKNYLYVSSSLIRGNSISAAATYQGFFGDGAGIYNQFEVSRVSNSTITGNTINIVGGKGAAVFSTTKMVLLNTTITDNAALGTAAAVQFDNPSAVSARPVIMNSIVARNTPNNCGFTALPAGSPPSGAGNLQDVSGCEYNSGGLTTGFTTNPALGLDATLTDDPVYPDYYMLQAGSPAIDMGVPSFTEPGTSNVYSCPGADQRWAVRPQKGKADGTKTCDIGAIELPNVDTGVLEYRFIFLPTINR